MNASEAIKKLVSSNTQIQNLESSVSEQCKDLKNQRKSAKEFLMKHMQASNTTCVSIPQARDDDPKQYLRLKKRESARIINSDTVKEAAYLITDNDIQMAFSLSKTKTVGDILDRLFSAILKKTTCKSSYTIKVEGSADRNGRTCALNTLPADFQRQFRIYCSGKDQEDKIREEARQKIATYEKAMQEVEPVVQKHLDALPQGQKTQKVNIRNNDGGTSCVWIRERSVYKTRPQKLSLKTFNPILHKSLDTISPNVSSQTFDPSRHSRLILDNRQALGNILAEMVQTHLSTGREMVKRVCVDQSRAKKQAS